MVSVADMIRRRNLRTRSIKMLVLDEADEMLNKGSCLHRVAVGAIDGFGAGVNWSIPLQFRNLSGIGMERF